MSYPSSTGAFVRRDDGRGYRAPSALHQADGSLSVSTDNGTDVTYRVVAR
jgi:hypothetical protein